MSGVKSGLLYLLLAALVILGTSCGANLYEATLSIAVVDEPYSYSLTAVDEDWELFDSSDLVFSYSSGSLPSGVVVGSNGEIAGTPTELGNFEFRVTVYAIDNDWYDWWYDDCWYGCWYDDGVTEDSEWYTLFVTEDSTNEDCPSSDNETTTELYVCLGNVEVESLSESEEFVLDINYFIDFDNAEDYDIEYIEFTVYYDSDTLAIDSNDLTSQSLREAATRTNATVTFDDLEADTLTIGVTGVDKSFHKSGRFIDLPFYALADVDAGELIFDIDIVSVISGNEETTLPTAYGIAGSLTVSE